MGEDSTGKERGDYEGGKADIWMCAMRRPLSPLPREVVASSASRLQPGPARGRTPYSNPFLARKGRRRTVKRARASKKMREERWLRELRAGGKGEPGGGESARPGLGPGTPRPRPRRFPNKLNFTPTNDQVELQRIKRQRKSASRWLRFPPLPAPRCASPARACRAGSSGSHRLLFH